MRDFLASGEIMSIVVLILAVPAVALIHWAVFSFLSHRNGRFASSLLRSFAKHGRRASLVFVVAATASVTLALAPISEEVTRPLRHALSLVLIASIAWVIVRLTDVAEDLLLQRFDIDQADNRTARRIRTQAVVLQRIVAVIVGVIALAVMLTTFPQVRVMGASILASAGVAGLVIGLAAQSTLSNLLAGVQIALTDPMRIDDVVVVENEWGRIEEITFTYVVVRIWDERRLIVPISYFATNPFENWTRNRSEILGSVMLRVDYTVPVDDVRQELTRLVTESPLWDGRLARLQVTDTTEQTVVLRALLSAADSSSAWDLRCEVREGLIDFIRERYPQALPRTRAEFIPASAHPDAVR